MLKPKAYLSKFNFLAIATKTEVQALNWLTAFFIFAASVILLSDYLSDFVRQYSFQVFLSVAICSLLFTGWRPLLNVDGKVLMTLVYLLMIYLGIFGLVELFLGFFGVEGAASPFKWRSDWILLALVAPFFEEIFFRDLILRAFYHRLQKLWLAIFLSSLLFMAAHLTLYPGAFILGLVSALLVVISKSLWPSIVFHSISNLSLLFIPAWFPRIWEMLTRYGLVQQFYR